MTRLIYARSSAIILSGLLIIALTVTTAAGFPDTSKHWAVFYIDHLMSRGLISGYPDGTFGPENTITRAEFITLLISALNKGEEAQTLQKGKSSYSDCAGTWVQGSAEVACELGLTWGGRGGLFEPWRSITREEASVMLVRALNCPESDSSSLRFTDSERIDPAAAGYVACAADKGLIDGLPDGSFRPGDPLTRSQACVIMMRFLAVQGADFDFYGQVRSMEGSGRLHIMINGAEQVFELSKKAIIYKNGGSAYASEIPVNSYMYFDVDSAGRIDFACISEREEDLLNLHFMPMPDYTKSDTGSGELNLMSEDVEESGVLDLENPGKSLDQCRAAMKADVFSKLTGSSGNGQLIAVIDSGVDAGHPDLQVSQQGQPKILDYIDLTDEGKVSLEALEKPVNDSVRYEGVTYGVKGIKSMGNSFRVAFLDTSVLPAGFTQNLSQKRLPVLAACGHISGVYDRLYFDLDNDRDFSDEKAIQPYSQARQTVTLSNSKNRKLNFVVSELDKKGAFARLSFDGLGHGTNVAGVASACGKIKGIAPGSTILPIKIVNRAGMTTIDQLKKAVTLAQERGSRIAIISMGQAELSAYERRTLEALARTALEQYGMILVMAAGNNGPGLESVSASADTSYIFSVGAYASPQMWKTDYGWEVKDPTLWYFSAAGPGSEAQVAPLVVAPGSAVSCNPLWDEQAYKLVQGTSIAAPNTAGALALLLEATPGDKYVQKTRAAWVGLLNGASPLPGFQPVEQGYGAVDLTGAWKYMKASTSLAPDIDVRQGSPGIIRSLGLYSRGFAPGEFTVSLTNNSPNLCELMLARATSWMSTEQTSLQLPGNSTRSFQVKYNDLDKSGLYSALLVADDKETLGFDAVALQTVIIPVKLESVANKAVAFNDQPGAGQYRRYFLEIPSGSTALDFTLELNGQGRVRLYLIAPDGQQHSGDFIGKGAEQEYCSQHLSNPEPGIWEAVVYSSASLSEYGLANSSYILTARLLKGQTLSPKLEPEYLVSVLPGTLLQNVTRSMITLKFWNPSSKQQAEGIVCVEGRLYQIEDGMVQIEQPDKSANNQIDVGW